VLGQTESLTGIVLPASAFWWVLIGLFGTAGQPGLGPSAHSTRLCRRQAGLAHHQPFNLGETSG
jgi:hypothetical protein